MKSDNFLQNIMIGKQLFTKDFKKSVFRSFELDISRHI